MGRLATSRLPRGGSQTLHSEAQNQKWARKGESGYVSFTIGVVPDASKQGIRSEIAERRAHQVRHRSRMDGECLRAGDNIRIGLAVGRVAMSPLSDGAVPNASV